MQPPSGVIATRVILIGGLAAGWLVGLIWHRSLVEATGYMDIPPELLLLGAGLCFAAGVAARVLATGHRRVRAGALAGVGMLATIVAGYALLALAYRDRFNPEDGGETWFSLLLEAWFWIGVPIVLSASLGALGWLVAAAGDRMLHGPAARST